MAELLKATAAVPGDMETQVPASQATGVPHVCSTSNAAPMQQLSTFVKPPGQQHGDSYNIYQQHPHQYPTPASSHAHGYGDAAHRRTSGVDKSIGVNSGASTSASCVQPVRTMTTTSTDNGPASQRYSGLTHAAHAIVSSDASTTRPVSSLQTGAVGYGLSSLGTQQPPTDVTNYGPVPAAADRCSSCGRGDAPQPQVRRTAVWVPPAEQPAEPLLSQDDWVVNQATYEFS